MITCPILTLNEVYNHMYGIYMVPYLWSTCIPMYFTVLTAFHLQLMRTWKNLLSLRIECTSLGTEGYPGGAFSVVVPHVGRVQDEADGGTVCERAQL